MFKILLASLSWATILSASPVAGSEDALSGKWKSTAIEWTEKRLEQVVAHFEFEIQSSGKGKMEVVEVTVAKDGRRKTVKMQLEQEGERWFPVWDGKRSDAPWEFSLVEGKMTVVNQSGKMMCERVKE